MSTLPTTKDLDNIIDDEGQQQKEKEDRKIVIKYKSDELENFYLLGTNKYLTNPITSSNNTLLYVL
jgi:hypothetical protein